MSEVPTHRPLVFSVVEDDGENVTIEISEEDNQADLAAGIDEEATMKPGRYKFKRGGFPARTLFPLILAGFGLLISISGSAQDPTKTWSPNIPKTWDEEMLRTLEVPLADSTASPRYISSEYYYRMPVRPIYKGYPVYRPGREPRGYLESLKRREPEIIFDPTKLKSQEDWIAAGELVFDAPIEYTTTDVLFSEVRDPDWYEKNRVPVTKSGILPFMQYVVREKGKIELGFLSCGHCHTRVLPDGNIIKGAQGSFPDDRAFGYETRIEAARARDKGKVLSDLRAFMRRSYAAPWLQNDLNARPDRMSVDEIAAALEAIPPGACARQGTSLFYPVRIPDLIGLKDRLYFDNTGLVRHRSIGDLMRYAALNQGADRLSLYGKFRPVGDLPEASTQSRYSDEQLYALAQFIYSLKPPANPHKFDEFAARGEKVFAREGCDLCHSAPHYTNNILTPADGFEVPPDHFKQFNIMDITVGTDPTSTLRTRRGTGYYKVPSLMGVWYRGPFEHNGSVATLEDWFDARRLKDNYIPTGFRGNGVQTRAVKGHEFGLDLSPDDRRALIAFLKTL